MDYLINSMELLFPWGRGEYKARSLLDPHTKSQMNFSLKYNQKSSRRKCGYFYNFGGGEYFSTCKTARNDKTFSYNCIKKIIKLYVKTPHTAKTNENLEKVFATYVRY